MIPLRIPAIALETSGRFDLITAFEIFEHVADVNRLMADCTNLLAEDGALIISTLLSDGFTAPQLRITWWYASPRNGHISLLSKQSPAILAASYGFKPGGLSAGPHVSGAPSRPGPATSSGPAEAPALRRLPEKHGIAPTSAADGPPANAWNTRARVCAAPT